MWDLRRRFFGDDTGPRSGPPTSKAKHVIVKKKKSSYLSIERAILALKIYRHFLWF